MHLGSWTDTRLDLHDEVTAAEKPGDDADLEMGSTLSEKLVDTKKTSTGALKEICKPEESSSGQQGEPEKLQRPQKRAAPETTDNVLTFQLRQHKMFLTMIKSGLSQLQSIKIEPMDQSPTEVPISKQQ